MRVWGEDAGVLAAAGLDVEALVAAERALGDGLALPPAPRGDAHAHLGRDADGHRMSAEDLIADMDRWGIARAVCFPADEPGPDGAFTAANAAVAAAARRHPDRLVPFCRVDPRRGAGPALEGAAADGARGLKLHPVAQRFALDAPEAIAAIADATARGWPVLVHAGFGARPLAGAVRAVCEAVPGSRLILAHGARGDARAVRALLDDLPGVWLDTSLAALPDLVQLPPARLVFGADRPYGEYATALQLVALTAAAARWSVEETAGVLGGNLAGLLAGVAA